MYSGWQPVAGASSCKPSLTVWDTFLYCGIYSLRDHKHYALVVPGIWGRLEAYRDTYPREMKSWVLLQQFYPEGAQMSFSGWPSKHTCSVHTRKHSLPVRRQEHTGVSTAQNSTGQSQTWSSRCGYSQTPNSWEHQVSCGHEGHTGSPSHTLPESLNLTCL